MSAGASESTVRMLLFEVGGTRYALPIEGVREVAELGRVRCVPGLPLACTGVLNWHGDALPVVSARHLFESGLADASNDCEVGGGSEHVLVVSDRRGDRAQLGLPVDRVLGLVSAAPNAKGGSASASLVAARQSLDGRVVSVLDPEALRKRAEAVIREAQQ